MAYLAAFARLIERLGEVCTAKRGKESPLIGGWAVSRSSSATVSWVARGVKQRVNQPGLTSPLEPSQIPGDIAWVVASITEGDPEGTE